MNPLLLLGICATAPVWALAIRFTNCLRATSGRRKSLEPVRDVSYYRPMAGLLQESDGGVWSLNYEQGRIRAEQRRFFRGYLHSLTQDYGRVLDGIRFVMAQSQTDR